MSRVCPLCHEVLAHDAPEANPKLAGRLVPTDEWPPSPTAHHYVHPHVTPLLKSEPRRWITGTTDYEPPASIRGRWRDVSQPRTFAVDRMSHRGEVLGRMRTDGDSAWHPFIVEDVEMLRRYFKRMVDPEPLYRLVWNDLEPGATAPMSWPTALLTIQAVRERHGRLPLRVELAAVPRSPTHPEEPR